MERVIEFKGANNTLLVAAQLEQFLQVDTLNIEVTADIPRTIILPEYSKLVNINLKINVIDKTGTAASNNITIQTQNPDLVNGAASVIINTNFGYAQVTGATLNKTKQYACLFGGALQSSSGGGGSIQTFDVTVPAARIIQILNNNLDYEAITPPIGLNNVIQVSNISFVKLGDIDCIAANPILIVSTAPANFGSGQGLFATPQGYLKSTHTEPTQMVQTVQDNVFPNNLSRLTIPSNGLFLTTYFPNANATSACDIRIFGTYIVKSLI